jgi:hypothetical protein
LIAQALIMDEVDGMAGNEDRGGVAELIECAARSYADNGVAAVAQL